MTRTMRSKLKRQRERRQVVFLAYGCILLFGLILLVFILTEPRYADEMGGTSGGTQTAGEVVWAEERAEAEPDAPPLSLGLGGDVTFGLEIADIVAREGTAYPWEEITSLFGEYDITAVNLEGPLCRGNSPGTSQASVLLRGDASCAAPMAGAGIDAVCLANDHAMDYGTAGLEETLNILRAHDVGVCGAGSSRSAAERPLVLAGENGATVALISFCDVAPENWAAGEDTPGIARAGLERIEELVGQAALEAHYVVVFVHWGEIGSQEIAPRQREIAKACVDAGADLVAGCHSHVVQGIEVISGVPVIYSLGNLVFPSDSEAGKNALFAGCHFEGGCLAGLEIVPLRIEGGRPVPLSGSEAENALRLLETASPGVRMEISATTATARIEP